MYRMLSGERVQSTISPRNICTLEHSVKLHPDETYLVQDFFTEYLYDRGFTRYIVTFDLGSSKTVNNYLVSSGGIEKIIVQIANIAYDSRGDFFNIWIDKIHYTDLDESISEYCGIGNGFIHKSIRNLTDALSMLLIIEEAL